MPALVNELKSPNTNVRRAAAEELGRLGSSTGSPRRYYNERNVGKLHEAIAHSRAVFHLLTLLLDNDNAVRRSAAQALGRLGDASAIAPLGEALHDRDDYFRVAAAEGLNNLASLFSESDCKSVVPSLINALEDTNRDVKENAARALGKLNDKTAVPALIEFLKDPRESYDYYRRQLRSVAVASLSRLRDASAIPILINLLETSTGDLRETVSHILESFDAPEAQSAIKRLAKDSRDQV